MVKHYSAEQWREFCDSSDQMKNRREMEQHLLECDECQRLFLQGIDQAEIEKAALMVPPDFTEHTLGRAAGGRERPAARKTSSGRQRLLAFYASAAAITLILMSGGVFQNLTERMNQAPGIEHGSISQRVDSFLYHWPDQVKAGFRRQIDEVYARYSKEVKR